MYITTVGLDLAKQVFQVHGVDEPGKVVIRKQLRRKEAQSQHCCYYPQSRRLKMVVFSRWIGARFDGKLRMFATPDPVGKRGKTHNGKQRSLCQDEACSPRTFIRDYTKRGYLPSVKRQIIALALNGSGSRDTARVLGISTDTVLSELKKRSASLSQ